MTKLQCRLGLMDETELPLWLTSGPQRIAETFRTASGDDIVLTVDTSRLASPRMPGNAGVEAYDLHRATAAIARNSKTPITNIALLFATRYARADFANVLGIMFDRGFTTPDDPSGSEEFMRIPREGAAVFLETIRRLRSNADDFERESYFTSIHEIGHIFNLQHDPGRNFMASSPLGKAFGSDYHVFSSSQCNSLARSSVSDSIRPGGSPFGSAASGSNHASVRGAAHPSAFGLALTIGLATYRFQQFEPIELDIELGVLPGIARTFRVPEQIDPGYENFALWIENPSGERRRYRSPRRYCSAPTFRRVAPDRPFRRDISIFAEAGGYTFTMPGIYRVWAEFRASTALTLRSNTVEFLVEPDGSTELDVAASALLGRRDIARLLYHRLTRAAPRGVATVARFCNEASGWEGIGRIEYALGRALVADSEDRMPSSPDRAASLRRKGMRLLERAQGRPGLGQNQQAHIVRILAKANNTT